LCKLFFNLGEHQSSKIWSRTLPTPLCPSPSWKGIRCSKPTPTCSGAPMTDTKNEMKWKRNLRSSWNSENSSTFVGLVKKLVFQTCKGQRLDLAEFRLHDFTLSQFLVFQCSFKVKHNISTLQTKENLSSLYKLES